MRRVIIFIATWLTAFAVLAQQPNPAPAASSQKPESLCALEGVVVDAATGAPISKAEVHLYFYALESHHLATTDGNGRFVFRDIPPGNYQLAATARGYVVQVLGHRPGWVGGEAIRLAPGDRLKNVQLRLTLAGVIQGAVRDEDGAPVMGVWVSVRRPSWYRDRRILENAGGVQTDDRGRYRIHSLYPGKYLVVAEYRQQKDENSPTYVSSYSPGTADPNQARWVEVRPGQEIPDVDIDLVLDQGVCVSGRVTNYFPANEQEEAYVQLVPIHSPLEYEEFNPRYPETVADMQGAFRICGVLAGDYIALARAIQGPEYQGRAVVEVFDTDVSEQTIPVGLPFALRGQLRADSPLDFTKVQVSLKSTDIEGRDGGQGQVRADGSFVIPGVFEGNYRLEVGEFPEIFYVESAHWGGSDVLANGLAANPAEAAQPIEVSLTINGAQINGTVTDHGKPVAYADVCLVPDRAHRERDDLYGWTRTDEQGRFVLLEFPPGDYTLCAFEMVDPSKMHDPEILEQVAHYGKDVHLEKRQRLTINLELAPYKDEE